MALRDLSGLPAVLGNTPDLRSMQQLFESTVQRLGKH